jgi:hypothetical protein
VAETGMAGASREVRAGEVRAAGKRGEGVIVRATRADTSYLRG